MFLMIRFNYFSDTFNDNSVHWSRLVFLLEKADQLAWTDAMSEKSRLVVTLRAAPILLAVLTALAYR